MPQASGAMPHVPQISKPGRRHSKQVFFPEGLLRSNLRHTLIANGSDNSNPMDIQTPYGLITLLDEPTYSFNSTDNEHSYKHELLLTDESITSVHGVKLNGEHILVIGAGGGCTAIHKHSAIVVDDRLYIAVGDQVACLSLEHPDQILWTVKVDTATCFGIYWANQHRVLLSHGELEITRLSVDGGIIWQVSGADIFSEGFSLLTDYIEAVDFDKSVYRFDYVTGNLLHCLPSSDCRLVSGQGSDCVN